MNKLIEALSTLDCGDNSCIFAKDKKGVRTNGGCRCLSGLKQNVRIEIEKIWYANKIKAENGERNE